jgi:hypothetical protein
MSQRVGDFGSILMGWNPPSFCENGTPKRSSDNTPNYWIALKDFSYNRKSDRYACSPPLSPRTMDIVEDTKIKKGDLLKRNFRYDNAVEQLVKSGAIIEVSKYKTSKNKQYLMYGLIAVAGYFAYKKFKK